jgi:hypothetical protein
MSYTVKIKKAGTIIKTMFVPLAESARDACDQAEQTLKLRPCYGTANPQTGSIEHVRWHGYEFCARPVEVER